MGTHVLSLDPGVTTGYTIAKIKKREVQVSYGQEKWTVKGLFQFICDLQPDIIVCEDFEYRPGTAKHAKVGVNLFPVQLIGICNLFWEIRQESPLTPHLFIQKAATGKSHYTDEKLKELELYVEGLQHGRDSVRHFLHWLNFGWGYQLVEGRDPIKYNYMELT